MAKNDHDDPMVRQSVEDLAQRLGVEVTSIQVVSLERGVWNDASIGCPQEDTLYSQAIVIGNRIILAHDGIEYSYHQAGDAGPFLCESPHEGSFRGEEGDVLIPPPGYDD